MKELKKAIEKAAGKFSQEHNRYDFDSFIRGAHSNEAKAFHQQGLYTEDEVVSLIQEYYKWIYDTTDHRLFESWFEEHKKK